MRGSSVENRLVHLHFIFLLSLKRYDRLGWILPLIKSVCDLDHYQNHRYLLGSRVVAADASSL